MRYLPSLMPQHSVFALDLQMKSFASIFKTVKDLILKVILSLCSESFAIFVEIFLAWVVKGFLSSFFRLPVMSRTLWFEKLSFFFGESRRIWHVRSPWLFRLRGLVRSWIDRCFSTVTSFIRFRSINQFNFGPVMELGLGHQILFQFLFVVRPTLFEFCNHLVSIIIEIFLSDSTFLNEVHISWLLDTQLLLIFKVV